MRLYVTPGKSEPNKHGRLVAHGVNILQGQHACVCLYCHGLQGSCSLCAAWALFVFPA